MGRVSGWIIISLFIDLFFAPDSIAMETQGEGPHRPSRVMDGGEGALCTRGQIHNRFFDTLFRMNFYVALDRSRPSVFRIPLLTQGDGDCREAVILLLQEGC